MAKQVRDIMTSNPVTLKTTDTAVDAARAMRDQDIGDVLVTSDGRIYGLLTDRDIVVRGVAQARDPARIAVGDICSGELTTVSPSDPIDHAVTLMRERALVACPWSRTGAPSGSCRSATWPWSETPNRPSAASAPLRRIASRRATMTHERRPDGERLACATEALLSGAW